ncbi:MAG: hypothetical protein ABI690_14740 [Chloroflexota bacterium]
MRRLLVILFACLCLLPTAAFAQDNKLTWDLDKKSYLDVTDLGFRFYYPSGWVYGSSGNGIAIAETQSDLDAQLDDDDSTRPDGQVISILGVPLTALTDLGDNPTLEQLTDFAVKSGKIKESDRFEVPVMARRAIWVVGKNSLGRSGVGTFWVQNGYLIVTSLGAPDADTISKSIYTWSYTLASALPLNAENLGTEKVSSDLSQFTMNYPDGWTPDPDPGQSTTVVYELADDVNQKMAKVDGIFLSVIDNSLKDLSFAADATLEDVDSAMNSSFGLDKTVTPEEFVFLDQPALVASGEIDDGSGGKRGLILTTALVGKNAVVFVLIAPTAERAAEFLPTWTAMLNSVTSTKAA